MLSVVSHNVKIEANELCSLWVLLLLIAGTDQANLNLNLLTLDKGITLGTEAKVFYGSSIDQF